MRMRSEILSTELDILIKERSQALRGNNQQKVYQLSKAIEKKTIELKIAKGEEDLQKAIENGTVERFNRLIAASQVLNSVTHSLIQEATEILKDNGLFTEGIVKECRTYNHAADRYFNEFKKLVDGDENAKTMFQEIDYFENWFRMWAKLKERPKEQRLRGCKKAAHKADGLRTCKKCDMIPNLDSIMCRTCSRSFVEGFKKGAKWQDNKNHPKEIIDNEQINHNK